MAPLIADGDGIVERLVANDHVKWWNKPNLRSLYLFLVPFALFIESTSGFGMYPIVNCLWCSKVNIGSRREMHSRCFLHLLATEQMHNPLFSCNC